MSTRSLICTHADGVYKCIYCHYDGYLEGVGKILFEHYEDQAKVDELIALGDISSIDCEVKPAPGVEHSFDAPAPGVVVAYHRDRGEDYMHPRRFNSKHEIYEARDNYDAEYIYVFENGEWLVTSCYEGENWHVLAELPEIKEK